MVSYYVSLPQLKAAIRTHGANAALKDGTVSPRTCTLDFVEVDPIIKAFRRMVRGLEFDVCEMAFTTYLCARSFGKPFTALPVFLVRGMHHGAIVHNPERGARTPKDLEDARVAVNRGYTVTTGVWARGILQDEYGVDLDRVTWLLSGDEHVAEYTPPPNVVPVAEGHDVTAMVASGELAAGIGVKAGGPDVVPLIDDPDEAAFAALERDGLYPINHLVVVRDELLDEYPDLAADLFEAFAAAKRAYVSRLASGDVGPADRTYARVRELLGDPLPYGVEPNRAMIEKLVDHAVRQHILPDRPTVESLFHPSTLTLSG